MSAPPSKPASNKTCAQRWQDKSNHFTHAVFESLTARIVKRPWTVIFICLVIAAGFSSLISVMKTENNPEKLFTPTSSQAVDDRNWVDLVFPSGSQRVFVYFEAADGRPANLLDSSSLKDNIKEVIAVRDRVLGISAPCESGLTCDTNPVLYVENCVTATEEGSTTQSCVINSVGDYFNNDATEVDSLTDADIILRLSNPNATDMFGQTISREEVMGGVEMDASGTLTSVAAFQLTGFLVNEFEDLSGQPDADPETSSISLFMYEDFFEFYSSGSFGLRTLPLTPAAQEEAEEEAFNNDFGLFIIGYVLLISYTMLVLSRRSWVRSRMSLTLAAVVGVIMAITSSFGFVAALGVKFNDVVQSLYVILLGLGVDDAFVIIDNYDALKKTKGIPIRMTKALGRAGSSILATSATDMIAFAAGTSTVLPAIRAFCIYACFGIIFDFAFQTTFFVACFYLDAQRQDAGRGDFCCCARRQKLKPTTPLCGIPCLKEKGGDEDALPTSASTGPGVASPGASSSKALAVADSQDERDERADLPMQRFIGEAVPKVILTPVGRVIVLVLAAIAVVIGVIGAVQLETEFDIEWFASKSNRIQSPLAIQGRYFPDTLTVYLYTGDVDYFALQSELGAAKDAFVNCRNHINQDTVVNWYAAFEAWREASKGAAAADADQFYTWVNEFVTTVDPAMASNVVFNDPADPTQGIRGARISAGGRFPGKALEQVDFMDDLRECVSPYPELEPRAYSFVFLFIEGLAVIGFETLRNVFTAGAAVFIVSMLVLADFYAALIVLLLIAAIDCCLLGGLFYAGYEFNSVITINIVLSVGLAVDYSLHIVHAFLEATGTKTERAHEALRHIGRSVLNGGITTFLAVVVLAPAESYIFQVFFASFTLTIWVGQTFGLVVLPVVLSLIGPASYSSRGGSEPAASKGSVSPPPTVAGDSPRNGEPQPEAVV